MSEADWWLCDSCSSLNNLAARKCYSCDKRKPKDAVRASEFLNYRPVVSWDGKVRLEQLPFDEQSPREDLPRAPRSRPLPPPLRQPMPRDTLAVAPRPPHPARITYRLDEQPITPPPRPAWGPTAASPPPGAIGPDATTARPPVPVGPGPEVDAQPPGEPWPHWKELLDAPAPQAERLRASASRDAARGLRGGAGSGADGLTLRSAIRLARTGDAREFVPWPEEDRRPATAEGVTSDDTGSPVDTEAAD